MSQYWSNLVHQLTPYVPGEQPKINNLIKLNTNESPYPPSPKVGEYLKQVDADSLRLYPDPNSEKLKSAIAEHFALNTNQVFVGNGSDEVLAHIFMGLLKQDKPILFPDISYSFYPVYCGLYQIEYQQIALNAQFEINPNDYQADNGGIIFPNPNAPTGQLLSCQAVEQLLRQHPNSVIVVDEAYIDFGGESATPLINQYPNLVVVQTFSKSRALAGARVGFAMAHPDLIEGLERIKNSFNSYPLDRLATEMACIAIQDQAYFETITHQIMQTRDQLTAFLRQNNFEVLPSQANFVFAKHSSQSADWLSQQLRERHIIVRHFKQPRIEQYLRITIGTEAENQALCQALTEILAE